MKTISGFRTAWIALVALSFVVFLGKAYDTSLHGIDSNIHAKVSLEVTSHGFAPRLPIPDTNSNGRLGGAYFNDHPFFYFWLNGWTMRALGPSAWSSRVLTATFSTGCVVLVFLLGMLLHSRIFGMIAALIFLFTRDIILTGASVSLDPPMMFFILLSFWLWQKDRWSAVALCVGVGLWIKTPVVLLVFPTAVVVSLWRGGFKEDFPKICRSAAAALALGSLVWITTGFLGGWDLVRDYWTRQLWGTVVKGRNHNYETDWFMFFRMIWHGFLPGLLLLPFGVFQIFRQRLWNHPLVQISLSAIAILFLAITPIQFRMDYYYNPVFPFLALLASFSVCQILKSYERQFYATISGGVPVLMSFLLCSPTSFGPESFVALRRFAPLIQSYGKCSILLIPGGEPLGSAHENKLMLNFYTGRTVSVEGCESVGVALRRQSPTWMILSHDNYDRCLTTEEQNSFRTRFAYGNLYLLTNLIPGAGTGKIDLTPLERELLPIVDCQAQEYPRDRYHRY
jgi:hypothetical protein